ncbi:hypothetical protein LOD99_11308 [Oopsacas minuta]|uniref:Uncharacterized protein n=1 Tax=Oopsacas minuta TaxID=111878 RepID=A0AAV7K7R5_9METZ|nr:hypothetical protein LOD99_11308 [Oopsacas minuta]
MYKQVFRAAASALITRYSQQDLLVAELVRCTLEDKNMVDKNLEELTRFYNGGLPELAQLRWERQAWSNL